MGITKSRYEVIAELETQKRTYIRERDNLDKNLYFTPSTYEMVTIPVKLIYNDRISYGNVFVGVSANLEYFKTRIV